MVIEWLFKTLRDLVRVGIRPNGGDLPVKLSYNSNINGFEGRNTVRKRLLVSIKVMMGMVRNPLSG